MIVAKVFVLQEPPRSLFVREATLSSSAPEQIHHRTGAMSEKEGLRVRQAGLADVDAVTDVLIAAMPADRDWWDYRFHYREQFPEEHRRLFRLLLEAWISPKFEDWVVMVAEVFDAATNTWQVGAYAAWDVAYVNRRQYGSAYQPLSGMWKPSF